VIRPLSARQTDEEHRASTPLELFFDLCFVVAVAQAANSVHHALAERHFADALIGYPTVFFAIWWAWMNFTWFASAYDNDDIAYRVATFVQISGVLILAAGVPRAFDQDWAVVTLGYAVMRASLAAQWLRAARSDPLRAQTDRRYAAGISACMIGWAALLVVPDSLRLPGFVVMATLELLVPIWAERPSGTTWHPRHIAERYGLFTLIVLGESVASATIAVQSALDAGSRFGDLAEIAVGGLLIVFSMWWVYFAQPAERTVEVARAAFATGSARRSFVWGYGHYVVFGSAAAVGAAVAVDVDRATGHAELTTRGTSLMVAVPVALYLLSVWALHLAPDQRPWKRVAHPIASAAILLIAFTGAPIVWTGLVLVALVASSVWVTARPTIRDERPL
jgi:low temperature requirement protein LtrA